MEQLLKNWKTSVFGTIGTAAVTTALLALTSPEFLATLQAAGVSPTLLILLGAGAKVVRDVLAKDATSKAGEQ